MDRARPALVATDPRNPAPSSVATRNVMRANRGHDTGLERKVALALRERGLRGFRTDWRTPFARADLAVPSARLAVFVHGCFWHGCRLCQTRRPRANRAFWEAKFRRNRERDATVRSALRRAGWKVVELRECQVKRNPARQMRRIERALAGPRAV